MKLTISYKSLLYYKLLLYHLNRLRWLDTMEKGKDIHITIEGNAENPEVYNTFLFKTTEKALEVDLAIKDEQEEKIELVIKQSFSIDSDYMLRFCVELLMALQDYEKKYNNGKGLPPFEDSEDIDN